MSDLSKYFFNHTMLRIKDPKETLDFYDKHFGMKVIAELKVDQFKFTNYFLAFDSPKANYPGKPWYQRQGVLELCHNWGVENDPEYKLNNGNAEPHRGFGHICFTVDNIQKACETLENDGVKFQKKLSEGRMHNIAFALDPNGYWIELLENSKANQGADVFDKSATLFNHTMYRIKDPKKSLKFYREVLGMKLLRTSDHPAAKFTNYFLGYAPAGYVEDSDDNTVGFAREGVLELCHNHGTEDDPDFKYHNGNEAPQGYGHIGIVVDDVDKAIAHAESHGASIKKRKLDGGLKFIGFIADPDGYMIEYLPPSDFPKNIYAIPE